MHSMLWPTSMTDIVAGAEALGRSSQVIACQSQNGHFLPSPFAWELFAG